MPQWLHNYTYCASSRIAFVFCKSTHFALVLGAFAFVPSDCHGAESCESIAGCGPESKS